MERLLINGKAIDNMFDGQKYQISWNYGVNHEEVTWLKFI